MIKHYAYLFLMVIMLTGCTSFASWKHIDFSSHEAPIDGALNIEDKRPPILRRCVQPYNYWATCDYGFTDSNKNILNIFDDLVPTLDSYARKIPQLKNYAYYKSSKNRVRESLLAYKMYLVTISPAVVVVVPSEAIKEWPRSKNCGKLLVTGCIQSKRFRGNAYWFRHSPEITEGSFWFTPGEPKGTIHHIDTRQNKIKIIINDAEIMLTQEDGNWTVNRLK